MPEFMVAGFIKPSIMKLILLATLPYAEILDVAVVKPPEIFKLRPVIVQLNVGLVKPTKSAPHTVCRAVGFKMLISVDNVS
jgi:hypothetical protein